MLRVSFWLLLPETVETMPALWPLLCGLGLRFWVPLPVGCWLKGQFCSLVRAQGLLHPHSVTERRDGRWRGISPSQLEGDKMCELALGKKIYILMQEEDPENYC